MQCAEFEVRLCDYQDGSLDPAGRLQMESHAAACPSCAALLADSGALQGFLAKVEPVEAPGELVTHILYRTLHTSAAREQRGWRSWFRILWQPRFAMSMAMTILSVSMLYRVAGVQIRQLDAADLNPASIWRNADYRVHRIYERTVKFYQNIRFIYEIVEQFRTSSEVEERVSQPPAQPSTEAAPGPPGKRADPRRLEATPARAPDAPGRN